MTFYLRVKKWESQKIWKMKNKSIYDSGTTKGSAPRTSNKKKYDENWEKIFGKKKKDKKSKWVF